MVSTRQKFFPKTDAEGFPAIRLEGFRIFLRPPDRNDWQKWAGIRGRNRDFLRPFEPRWSADWGDFEYFERRLQRQLYNWTIGTGQSFLIFKKDSALIGGLNINNINRGAAQHAALGYWIDRDHQGQGLMSEALRLVLKYCFEPLALERLHAAHIPENDRSRNLLLRAGFRQEGFAEKYIEIDGVWRDHVLYGLTRVSWENFKNLPKEI